MDGIFVLMVKAIRTFLEKNVLLVSGGLWYMLVKIDGGDSFHTS